MRKMAHLEQGMERTLLFHLLRRKRYVGKESLTQSRLWNQPKLFSSRKCLRG